MAGVRIPDFDTWRPRYGGASIKIVAPGTTTPVPIFLDHALTVPAVNPQILLSDEVEHVRYGKWEAPVYIGQPYELQINGVDKTGIVRIPVTDLVGMDGSFMTATTSRSLVPRRLTDRFDDTIHAKDFGELGGAPAVNTATINAAIGAAAGQGGGVVTLPAQTIQVTTLTLSAGVILRGQGITATTLQSQQGTDVITLSGARAGLEEMTLDGISLIAGSVGVAAIDIDCATFTSVMVKRFETGIRFKGGSQSAWHNFSIDNCVTGAHLAGDSDAGGTGGGDRFEFNVWSDGRVTNCTGSGVILDFEDRECRHNTFRNVGFEDNPGAIALDLNGARYSRLEACFFSNNLTNIRLRDDSDTSQASLNTVVGFLMTGGFVTTGAIEVQDTAASVVFEQMAFAATDWTLTTLANPVLLRDVVEDALVTVSGDTRKLVRITTTETGEVAGITTDATPINAWSLEVPPGRLAYVEAKVIANQRDGVGHAIYHIAAGARRPGSTLGYDEQTANFGLGDILTGATSEATARIVADADGGVAGTLTLRDFSGEFLNNEIVTSSSGGSARVNGSVGHANVALDGVGSVDLRTIVETEAGLGAALVVSGGEVQLVVTGVASKTFEWTVLVSAFVP